jgi:hypothetical protein
VYARIGKLYARRRDANFADLIAETEGLLEEVELAVEGDFWHEDL